LVGMALRDPVERDRSPAILTTHHGLRGAGGK
jgi:hypothetical protein